MAGFVDKLRTQRKHEKLAREMTHAKSYDNASARRKAWGEVKAAPGQYAQGMFTDFVGAPVDIANMALSPFGLGSEKPVMGSRHLAGLIGADETALPYQVAQYIPFDAGDIAMSAKLWGPALVAALGSTAIASKASKGAKLSDLAQVMPKQRGIFAGVGAKTANHANLDLAKKLQAQGVPDPDIWKQTGWALDPPDKIPRFEIPDDASKIEFPRSGEKVSSQEAYDVISHRDLQSAYPESPSLKIVNKDDPTFRGAYFDNLDGITVMQPNERLAHSTTLHELQHAIQQREGFARGGSPDAIARDPAQYLSQSDIEYAQSLPAYAKATDKESFLRDYAGMRLDDPRLAYQRLAGEAEARLTQARMNMTPEQRLAQYPYEPEYFQKATGVPLSDLIVRRDGGTAMSLPYQIEHKPMTIEGGASQLHDLTNSFGEDIYGRNALEYFGSGDDREKFVLNMLRKVRGNPDAKVTIYRGVPSDVDGINAGDWVTLHPDVAKDYADLLKEQGTKGKIVKMEVPASSITSWPDSLLEFGYYPKGGTAMSVPKTEFELAHEVAQRNAALPIEQGGLGLPANNTAMDRAKAMGFDTPAYHASDADIKAFDMAKSGSNTLSNTDSEWANRLANAGVWSANEDVTLAARRALGKESGMFGDVVYPLLIENPKATSRSLDTLERKLKKGKLKNTTKVNDEEFGVTSYVSPNPANIRSRFAAFDPMQRNSANILAGGAAGAIGLSSLADLINRDEYQ